MAGKGDKRRPTAVKKEQFDENYEKIFGKWTPSWAGKNKKKKLEKGLTYNKIPLYY